MMTVIWNIFSTPPSDINNSHEVCVGSQHSWKGTRWHSGTQWKPERSLSAASLPKLLERICHVAWKRLPDGSRCSFIKFWNLAPYIRQKSILCHQTISYRINDSFSFLPSMFSWFIVAHQSFTVHISRRKPVRVDGCCPTICKLGKANR